MWRNHIPSAVYCHPVHKGEPRLQLVAVAGLSACVSVCVFADCLEVAPGGLKFLSLLPWLQHLIVRDFPANWLSHAVSGILEGHCQLRQLYIGDPDADGPQQKNIPIGDVVRSVRLHTHKGSYIPTP